MSSSFLEEKTKISSVSISTEIIVDKSYNIKQLAEILCQTTSNPVVAIVSECSNSGASHELRVLSSKEKLFELLDEYNYFNRRVGCWIRDSSAEIIGIYRGEWGDSRGQTIASIYNVPGEDIRTYFKHKAKSEYEYPIIDILSNNYPEYLKYPLDVWWDTADKEEEMKLVGWRGESRKTPEESRINILETDYHGLDITLFLGVR